MHFSGFIAEEFLTLLFAGNAVNERSIATNEAQWLPYSSVDD